MNTRSNSRCASLTRGTFELYGLTFRWFGPQGPRQLPNGIIPLVRETRPLLPGFVRWLNRGNQDTPWFGRAGEDYAYRFDGLAEFLLPRDGSLLRAFIQPQARPEDLHFALARGVLPRMLHLRGVSCLHASAVRVGDKIVGFLGHSGMGKSTVAAALVARGYPLVSDDVLPVCPDSEGKGILGGPGLAEFRLMRHSAYLAGVAGHFSPRPAPMKWLWAPEAGRRFSSSALLAGLYLLRPRRGGPKTSAARCRRLAPVPALFTLIQNSFWLHPNETRPLARDLTCFSHLVRSVPIYKIYYRLNQAGLTALERVIQRMS